MGRPKKGQEYRNRVFSMRLTDQQHADLVAKAEAAGITMVDFLLAAAERAQIIVGEAKPASEYITKSAAHLELRREVNAMGRNLNQIAWRMNAEHLGGRLGEPIYRSIIDGQQTISAQLEFLVLKVV